MPTAVLSSLKGFGFLLVFTGSEDIVFVIVPVGLQIQYTFYITIIHELILFST